MKTSRLEWGPPVWAGDLPSGLGACRLGWGLPYGGLASELGVSRLG